MVRSPESFEHLLLICKTHAGSFTPRSTPPDHHNPLFLIHYSWGFLRHRPLYEAITAVFPQTLVQTCIVHLIRYSMQFASWKERKAIIGALKPIYRADSAEAARAQLEEFDAGPWGQKYPAIAQSWRRNWEQVIPFFAFSPEVRKIIYTTNAIESLHSQVRKAVRGRGHFPNDEAATKLIWLVLRNITAKWKNPPIAWHAAKTQLALQFEDRFVMHPV
jgi:putative transposase